MRIMASHIRGTHETAKTIETPLWDFGKGCWVMPRQHLRALFSDLLRNKCDEGTAQRKEACRKHDIHRHHPFLKRVGRRLCGPHPASAGESGAATAEEVGHLCPSALLKMFSGFASSVLWGRFRRGSFLTRWQWGGVVSVSYTHLTLPTILLV